MVEVVINDDNMERLELIERIVSHLHKLDNESLQDLLLDLEQDNITDENLDLVTYGADDTEHLLSSPRNAQILQEARRELQDQELLTRDSNQNVA
ncbi:MAG: hypothetical protein GVY04_23070 [Cyanobacteria bacterium]|jgi:hypothetical protein|nr:hypothetical protein [Cyanobacteria bacterium GSL.Bin1]